MPRMVQWPLVSMDRTPGQEGLRERKKRLVRQQLSDTATEMFLERGFDNVRVTEIAEACGVSEKTVYNYFPTKESLILDRWQSTPAALLRALADPNVPTVDAALRVIDDELTSWTTWIAGLADQVAATARIRRFGDLVQATPSLRAYEREQTDLLVGQAALVLAGRMGMEPQDPEPRIAAAMILELWTIQARSLRKHLDAVTTPTQLQQLVASDVHRAALLITGGLDSLETFVEHTTRGTIQCVNRPSP